MMGAVDLHDDEQRRRGREPWFELVTALLSHWNGADVGEFDRAATRVFHDLHGNPQLLAEVIVGGAGLLGNLACGVWSEPGAPEGWREFIALLVETGA